MARVPEIIRSGQISQVAAQPAPQAGQGFFALASLAKAGADFVKPKALEQAAIGGAQAVYRDDTGQLRIDDRSILGGELADAHNGAAYAKYLAQRNIDIRDTMTELATRYQFDPAGFRAAADGYIGLLQSDENVPALLREDVVATAQNEASARFNGLHVAETDRTYREADRETAAHRDMLADDYINLMMQGDTEGAAAIRTQMEAVSAYRGTADFISETPSESAAYLRGVEGAAQAAMLTRRLDALEGATSISDEERSQIQSILDDPNIDPSTRMRLYAATEGRLIGIDGRAAAEAVAAQSAVDAYTGGAGVTDEYLASIRAAESGGNDAAANPNSSALGRYQFTSGTWLDLMRDHPELGLTATGRTDAAQQERAIRAFTADNAAVLSRNGIETTGGNLYAAHFLGAGGAVDVLTSDPNAQLTDILPAEVIQANGFLNGMTVSDFQSWAASKGGGGVAGVRPPVDVGANRTALEAAGMAVSPGAEFFAGAFGVSNATALYQADPAAAASSVLPADLVEANPVLSSMTVQEAQMWADRRAVVKASDLAARRAQLDQIPNEEVRAVAVGALNDLIDQRRRQEDARAAEYQQRLEAADDTLTEIEVMSDNSLSDQAQRAIVSELRSQRADQIAVSETISRLNDDTVAWDAYDSTQRGAVNDAYKAMIGEDAPLSPAGIAAAAGITLRTGFVPQAMFNALRGAANGSDPVSMAAAMEFAGQITAVNPNAFGALDGRTEVLDALADYKLYAGYMGSAEAAAQVIANNAPENQARLRNLSDQARDAAKRLKPADITSHLAANGVSASFLDDNQQGALMADYEAMFTDAFSQTGDVALAKNRALENIARVYGPSGVTSGDAIMRFPPVNFYAPVNGSHDWMREQLIQSVQSYYTATTDAPEWLAAGARDALAAPGRIMITSDAYTQADVAAGRDPSYRVKYLDEDDMLQYLPGRAIFERPADTPLNVTTLQAERNMEEGNRNTRLWFEYYRSDPERSLSLRGISDLIMGDLERHRSAPPPVRTQ